MESFPRSDLWCLQVPWALGCSVTLGHLCRVTTFVVNQVISRARGLAITRAGAACSFVIVETNWVSIFDRFCTVSSSLLRLQTVGCGFDASCWRRGLLLPHRATGVTISVASTSSSKCTNWPSSAIALESIGILCWCVVGWTPWLLTAQVPPSCAKILMQFFTPTLTDRE